MYEEEVHFRNCYLNGFGIFDPGDLWPSDPTINKVLLLLKMDVWTNLRKVGQGVLEFLIGNSVYTFDPGDLDLWPSDPKSKGFLWLGWMCGPCLRNVRQTGFEFRLAYSQNASDICNFASDFYSSSQISASGFF